MTHRGLVKGKTIEFEEPLPFPEGQPVSVIVCPVEPENVPGSPAVARKMMHEPPCLELGDIEEFERVLRDSELPLENGDIFHEDGHE